MADESMRVPQMLRVLRILIGALVFSLLNIVGLAAFVIKPSPDPEGAALFMSVWAVLSVGLVIAYFVVHRVREGALRRRFGGGDRQIEEDEPLIVGGYLAGGILGAALTEGGGAFAGVIYMLTASRLALLGVGVGILLLLLQLPTRDRYNDFVQRVTGRRPA